MRRETEVASLARLLREAKPGLQVAAITGPGGVGKSYLLDEVFTREPPRNLEYMHLLVDGANPQTRQDFFGLVDGQLAARSLPAPAPPDADYFPQVRKVAAMHRALVDESMAELARLGAHDDLKKTVAALLRAGRVLNETIPPSKKVVDVSGVDEKKVLELLDSAWEAVDKLRGLKNSALLPGPLKDLFGITAKNRVRRDLYNFAADALVGDVTAALVGYRPEDRFWKLTHNKLEGFQRLLIVLDDFEATAPVLGDFVFSSLLKRLAAAPFPTVVFIACRDDLEAVHPGFGQHAKRWLAEDIQLRSFDRETAFELMTEAGIPSGKQALLFEMTHGFPYLLSLVIEQATAPDGQSALFSKKFYERTTRWMNEKEREWFRSLCYLDVVNENTIAALVGDAVDAEAIQGWFERESSIRDPIAPVFTIRPLVREKCLQYFATRAPKKHREFLERAKGINHAAA